MLDLVVGDAHTMPGQDYVLSFLGDRAGVQQLELPTEVVVPFGPMGDVVVEDLDDDGRPDIIVAHAGPAGFTVIHGR